MKLHLSLPVFLGVLGGLAEGQISSNSLHGPGAALASSLSLTASSPARTGNDVIYVSEPGAGTSTVPWNSTSFPTTTPYHLTSMFPNAALRALLEIDAQSTGNDYIPDIVFDNPSSGQNRKGKPDVIGANSWLGLAVSVEENTPGSVLPFWAGNGANVAAYYFEGSTGIDPVLVDKTVLEKNRSSFGLSAGDDLDGLDFGLGVIAHAGSVQPQLMFTQDLTYYFSVSHASAAAINAASIPFDSNGGAADPGTIYELTCDELGGTWGPPTVYLTPAQLDLAADDDVDAICIHDDESLKRAIFSLTKTSPSSSGISQLRVHEIQPGGGSLTADLVNESDELVVEELGLNGDNSNDIDATCGWDPEAGGTAPTHLGIPNGRAGIGQPDPNPMGVSLTLSEPAGGGGNRDLHIGISGLGNPTAVPGGYTVLFYTFDVDQQGDPINWDVFPLTNTQMIRTCADEVHHFVVPMGNTSVGQELYLFGYFFGANYYEAESLIGRIYLP